MTLAAAGVVRIVNRAFQAAEHLHRLDSLDDGSTEADSANLFWRQARLQTLEAVDWNFARVYARVNAVSGVVTHPNRPHAFVLPPACIRVRQVVDPQDVIWERQGDVLAADDAGPLTIAYTTDIEDTTKYPPNFEAALVALLGSLIAPGFTRSANRAQILAAQFQDIVDAAAQADSLEQSVTRAFVDENASGTAIGAITAPAGGGWYGGSW